MQACPSSISYLSAALIFYNKRVTYDKIYPQIRILATLYLKLSILCNDLPSTFKFVLGFALKF